MSHPLLSSRAKVHRAYQHLEVLSREIRAFLESKPYSVTTEFDPNHSQYLSKVRIREETPDTWGLLIGDCVHNARCALDHVVWGLSEWYCGSEPGDTLTQFPICDTSARFDSAKTYRLRRLPEFVRTYVEMCQPYKSRHPYDNTPLWGISVLDNADKHKQIVTVGFLLGASEVTVSAPVPDAIPTAFTPVFLEDGAIIATTTVPPHVDPAKVKVEGDFIFDITFRDAPLPGLRLATVENVMKMIVDAAQAVVDIFDRMLLTNYGIRPSRKLPPVPWDHIYAW